MQLVKLLFILLAFIGFNVLAEETPETLLSKAKEYERTGDLVNAAKTYQHILQIDPKNNEAIHGLKTTIVMGQVNDPYSETTEPFESLVEENHQKSIISDEI